ncbi:hypothetical protein BB559_002972 [Furculomyces boomerangus]|uniref:Peroxisome assembly protein 12 n=1 Tax=Furculomyces boomerangus TaxID=61424 RepID=A0A2T9YQ94_9FUNG|nr:hypothetical protein BB559_002972 [Furculomyces boomerangus]
MEYMNSLSGGDLAKPSLFEVISQGKLNDLLEPAIRHLTSYYAHRYPRQLIPILNYHEECYALLMYFVEKHYFSNYGGSFFEHFFGIKRERVYTIKGSRSLTNLNISLSAIAQVLLPVLAKRSEQYYQKLSQNVAITTLFQSRSQETEKQTKYDQIKV